MKTGFSPTSGDALGRTYALPFSHAFSTRTESHPLTSNRRGRSLRIFKSEMKDMKNDDKNENKDDTDGSAAR
jgi:hypothetical protein